jgi:hypothetical protein
MQVLTNPNRDIESGGVGARIPLESLHETGSYVCDWSGHLVRITGEAVNPTGSPFFNIVAREPLFLTKLSDDPFVPLSKARQIASNLDVSVNF